MLRFAAAGVVPFLLLAGCASPTAVPAAAPVQDDPAPAWSLDWSQRDCESMTWSVPVLASSLQPYLPEGFEPTGTEAPLAAGQAATLGFRAVECSEGFGQGDLLRSVQSGFLFTNVIPPAELRDDRFTAHYAFGWDVLSATESWREAASSWRLPLHDGGALIGPTAQGWTGALAMDRVGTFSIAGRTLDGGRPVDGYESRTITPGAQGFALWDATVENLTVATGAGVWTVSPESWVATVLGATQGAATFELATWSLPRALVHWPGQALGPIEDGGSRLGEDELPDLPPLAPLAPRIPAN